MSYEEILKNPICSKCGCTHFTRECDSFPIKNDISNKLVPSKARLSLPDSFIVKAVCDGTNQVVAKTRIVKDTRLGPMEAPKTFTLNPEVLFSLKIFPYDDEAFIEYYLDTSNEHECSWLMFVQAAEFYEEQNLICYQDQSDIYYITTKDVEANECLKVWYAPYYASKMKKNILEKKCVAMNTLDLNARVISQQKILERENWACKFCGVIETKIISFANHILEHYTAQLRKICEICKATFNSRKGLLKHMKVLHNPHNKKALTKETQEKPSNQNNISKDVSIGGPLLNNLELDNYDNSNLLFPSLNLPDDDLNNMGTENLNVDNLLTENVRILDHFNFEIGECQEEFVCDICVKSFSKLRYLITHIKRHTGDYFCAYCEKVFCRKENLNNHQCTKKKIYICDVCGKISYQLKYHTRHMDIVHNEKFKCTCCNHIYSNKYELERHNCKANETNSISYSCSSCDKTFTMKSSLKTHIAKSHSLENSKTFVCYTCAKQYTSKYALDTHMKTHGDPNFQCEKCQKKFYRKDVYLNHLCFIKKEVYKCDVCDKEFNAPKNLFNHKKLHIEPKFKCLTCNAAYRTKFNLEKHVKIHHKTSKPDDAQLGYTCPHCQKKVKLRSSLLRHINRQHSDQKNKNANLDAQKTDDPETIFPLESEMNSLLNNSELDLMANSKDNIDIMNDADMNELDDNLRIQMIDNILLNTTNEMGIELNDDLLGLNNLEINSCLLGNDEIMLNDIQNREVSLSMPDLMEQDHQDISLHDDAFILDHGLVESEVNADNVVVYILNQAKAIN